MAQTYTTTSGRTIQKRGLAGKQFYTTVYTATRETDKQRQRGLLFQHQQKLKTGKMRKLGANFFVPEKDLPGFLNILREVLTQNGNQFTKAISTKVANIITPSLEDEIRGIGREVEQLEAQLASCSKDQQAERDRLQREIAFRDDKITSISRELAEVRRRTQRVRILEMEHQVPLFKQHLADFRRLIEEGDEIAKSRGIQQESLYQDFLFQHFWMFGLGYVSVKSKPKSAPNRSPDFLLQRADGFNDVVELENPTDPLFVKTTRRPEQSGSLKEALAQTMDYVDDYTLRHRDEYYEQGLDTYKPNGIIVIGRQGTPDLERRRRQLNAYLHGIQIWTYDDLINNAEQVISLLETGPLTSETNHTVTEEEKTA